MVERSTANKSGVEMFLYTKESTPASWASCTKAASGMAVKMTTLRLGWSCLSLADSLKPEEFSVTTSINTRSTG